jgi:hypothetical protein
MFDGMSAGAAIDPHNYSTALTIHHSNAAVTMANRAPRARYSQQSADLFSGEQSADNEITQQESKLLNLPCAAGY